MCVETPVLGFGVFGAVPNKETNVSCTSLGVARLEVRGIQGGTGESLRTQGLKTVKDENKVRLCSGRGRGI